MAELERQCRSCGKTFTAKRADAMYCPGGRCKKRAQRGHVIELARHRPKAPADKKPTVAKPRAAGATGPRAVPDPPPDGVYEATKLELKRAGRVETTLGQLALALAERIDTNADTGSAIASLTRELRATLEQAVRGASAVADPLDELMKRRNARLSGA